MKTSVFSIVDVEVRTSTYIRASHNGKTIILPYSKRYMLHPGYVEPTYLNSLVSLQSEISRKLDEMVVSQPNPYYSYGVGASVVEMYFLREKELYTPYVEWLINLLEEIKNNGGYLMYNHPKRVVRNLRYAIYEIHSHFGYHSEYSPITLKEAHKICENYKLDSDYPETMFPEL